ncbi:MAG: chaperone DnaJ domain protein [Verrucomicrobiales bacterium]|nr:chaperone DnaJ domain protein [Verrucomicrobiales bacterium]
MAVEFKDYYKTLGVARTATEDEIRKSFRKLARQYHPDVAKNKVQAEEKFKEINEAYEVLGDKEKRQKYDTLGPDWQQQFRPPPRPGGQTYPGRSAGGQPSAEDFHFGGTGFSDFFEQMFGARGRGGFSSGGAGAGPYAERGEDVEGEMLVTLSEAMNGSVRKISLSRNAPCERCRGTGEMQGRVCPNCGGAGKVERTESYQVKIPAGVREGQKLRLAGRGEAGVGRGPAGDLFLRVKFAAHPEFRVEGGDLYHELELAPWEAALGTTVAVPTLDKPVTVKIPPGMQTGQKLRIKGRGLPDRNGGAGDMYVIAKIEMPPKISERERELWQQLATESKFNPRE